MPAQAIAIESHFDRFLEMTQAVLSNFQIENFLAKTCSDEA